MGSKNSAPPAPDYTGAASATAAGNLQNLQYQTAANRPDIYTPWGSQTWSQDANGKWTQNVSLSPDQQASLDAQQKTQLNQSQLAQGLQGQVASTMASGFNAPSMNDYLSHVGSVNSNFGGFTPYGVGATDQSQINVGNLIGGNQAVSQNLRTSANPVDQRLQSSGQHLNTDAASAVSGAGQTDLNAPQFSDATAQAGASAAYGASTALLKDQWAQDTKALDEKLRLQGLTPGTEAYNTAAQNLSRTQAQQQNALANQAVVTGNSMANQNYASALSGYQARNDAQNQAYGQSANTFTLGNAAKGQQYGQDASTFTANNDAANQQYGRDANTMSLNNSARTQNLSNALSVYGAQLQGQQAYNQSQNQAYNQALAAYGADTAAQQASNQAQAQQYQQALSNYNTAYNSAYQNYMTPLNSMNAVLTGNQVQNPNFGSFGQAGYVNGTDYSTAAQNLGQYNSAAAAAKSASNASNMGLLGSLGSAALMSWLG